MKERKVVVTGLGAVTPVGNNVETMWKNLIACNSGINLVTRVHKEEYPAVVAAELKDFNPALYIDKKDDRKMDPITQYAVAASKMTIEDAKLTIDEYNANRVGVWIVTGIGGMKTREV